MTTALNCACKNYRLSPSVRSQSLGKRADGQTVFAISFADCSRTRADKMLGFPREQPVSFAKLFREASIRP